MTGITISALAGVNTILGPEEIPLVQNGVTSTVTPTLLASFIAGVNTAGTVRSVNVAVSTATMGLTFTGGPITNTGTITMGGVLAVEAGGTSTTASTGTGPVVLRNSPTVNTATLITPILSGVASANTINAAGMLRSTVSDGALGLLVNGGTKGVRISPNATETRIEGVDNTGVGSFQPLVLSGSLVAVGTSLQYGGVTLSNTVTGTGSMVLSNSPAINTAALTNSTQATASTFTNSTVLASTAYADRIGVQQVVSTITGAVATGTTVIPIDDTIPQSGEGDQYMSLTITPRSATSKLIIEVVLNGAISTAVSMTLALFQDSTANALAAIFYSPTNANFFSNVNLTHTMTAGTTSATTFKVRAGPSNTGTMTFNGSAAARVFGGVMASSIVIMEVGS